jgi:hypothetical protein
MPIRAWALRGDIVEADEQDALPARQQRAQGGEYHAGQPLPALGRRGDG